MTIKFDVSGSGVVSPSASLMTLEEKVAYLLKRDQAAQGEVNELAVRLSRLESESPKRLAELRRKMVEHFAAELTAALEAYRPLRVAGTIALAFGLACVTTATFLA